MTETTQETIKIARSWLENEEKFGDPNAPTPGTMTALAVVELAEKVKGLEEKYRWRKYQDEPLSTATGYVLLYYKTCEGNEIFVMGDAREVEEQYAGVWGISEDRRVYKLSIYWHPLDLPEEAAK
ncbi:hypothetical protein [Cloacibacillus sp. An23]|uniref:hypothetical protein n=1 Tax=Cloacibacillus sp. An23 TaxID=1965591 RepID=UPI000B3822F7|nr:hypothetical protein [Cloacibacillus sp. An23]OUO94776.1 hypothetical protein B5F39_02595 [Cloacibacillus sp. An23]